MCRSQVCRHKKWINFSPSFWLGNSGKKGVLGRKEWAGETDFALYEATAIVDRMSEEYGFNYCDAFEEGVCKSDQASIPQFGAGKT